MLVSYNNIYKYDTLTFGKNIYGPEGGDIYIVQTDYSLYNYYKIGITNNLYKRMKDYRCGSVLEPRLHYYYPCSNIKKTDILMKQKLNKFNIKREIYNADLDVIREIIKEDTSKKPVINSHIIRL